MPFPLGALLLVRPDEYGRVKTESGARWRSVSVDRELFYVYRPFRWTAADRARCHTVPEGAVTDFASLPEWMPFATSLIGEPHEVSEAAVIHDDLYVNAGLHPYTRKAADRIFYDILLEIGVPKWRAKLMHWGVRAGGGGAWKRHTRRNQRDGR